MCLVKKVNKYSVYFNSLARTKTEQKREQRDAKLYCYNSSVVQECTMNERNGRFSDEVGAKPNLSTCTMDGSESVKPQPHLS